MTDTERLVADDRIAEVPMMGELELLALRESAAQDGEPAQDLIEAIDHRLAELDLAAGVRGHGEEFARAMLRIVERRSVAGGWVWAQHAFQAALAESRASPYVAYLAENPKRRLRFADILEGVRTAEFPHLDQRKDSTWQGGHVYFRTRRRD